MEPTKITGQTRALGKPRDWNEERDGLCGTLFIRDEPARPGCPPRMVSRWRLNGAERAAVAAGAPILLAIVGVSHPPVWVSVGNDQDEDLQHG